MNNKLSHKEKPERSVSDEIQEFKDIIAHNICFYRKCKKLTQEQLGEISGVGISTIKKIETAKENVTVETIAKLCVALDKFRYNLVKEKIHETVK